MPGVMRVPAEGRIPRPPRLVHDKRIRTLMIRAYYEVLNDDDTFRSALTDLLDHWTWSAAERFAQRWHLQGDGRGHKLT